MATTSLRNLPYPLGTDRVMDGDDAIRRLAQSVDNMIQSAIVTLPNLSAAGTPVSFLWTFPIPFAALPFCIACINGGAGTVGVGGIQVAVTSASPTNVTVWGVRAAGTNGFTVNVMAIGPVAAVA